MKIDNLIIIIVCIFLILYVFLFIVPYDHRKNDREFCENKTGVFPSQFPLLTSIQTNCTLINEMMGVYEK